MYYILTKAEIQASKNKKNGVGIYKESKKMINIYIDKRINTVYKHEYILVLALVTIVTILCGFSIVWGV